MNQFDKIRTWAVQRNLVEGSDSKNQMLKLMEEMGELADAIGKKNRNKLVDSIGDMVVVLTILAQQNNTSIEYCITEAYNEIKDRKGKMVDGIFVKEDDFDEELDPACAYTGDTEGCESCT